jgi:hypothetical protein
MNVQIAPDTEYNATSGGPLSRLAKNPAFLTESWQHPGGRFAGHVGNPARSSRHSKGDVGPSG